MNPILILVNKCFCILVGTFWYDIIVAFTGAFFGLFFALLANRCLEEREKQKDKKEKKEQDIERLHYLSTILKSTVHTTKSQTDKSISLAIKIRKNPLEIFELEYFASFDVWRLRNLDSIELFDSYRSIFKEKGNSIIEYKNIFSKGDYIFEKITDLKLQNEKHISFKHKDQLIVRDCVDEIYIKICLRRKNIEHLLKENAILNPEFLYLKKFEDLFSSKFSDSFSDFKKIETEFLVPLFDTILDVITDNQFADSIFEIINKALNRLKSIELNSLDYVKALKKIKIELKQEIDYLDEQRIKIENKII